MSPDGQFLTRKIRRPRPVSGRNQTRRRPDCAPRFPPPGDRDPRSSHPVCSSRSEIYKIRRNLEISEFPGMSEKSWRGPSDPRRPVPRPMKSDAFALLAPEIGPGGAQIGPPESGPPATGIPEAATRFGPRGPKYPGPNGIWIFQNSLKCLKKPWRGPCESRWPDPDPENPTPSRS